MILYDSHNFIGRFYRDVLREENLTGNRARESSCSHFYDSKHIELLLWKELKNVQECSGDFWKNKRFIIQAITKQ